MANLYIVSTPIGNLGDITYRAVEVLGAVDRILAEDTRRTAVLLRHYGIDTPMASLHEHNEAERAARILEWLDHGEELAVVSDAGTPLLSDPGARIVQRVVEADHDPVPVPGPSAVLAALTAAGIDPEPFTFYGFPARRGRARRELLEDLARLRHTAVLFEAATRLLTLLGDLIEHCGPDRPVAVARELTKVHETVVRGTLADARDYYERDAPRGEIAVVLGGATRAPDAEDVDAEAARALARALLDRGRRPSGVARDLARRLGIPRNRAYEIALSVAGKVGGEID